MSDCRIRGHGELVERSTAMGDYYCRSCRHRHALAYIFSPTPGRRLVEQEAARRGDTCEFTLAVGDAELRCASRFEDGSLQWHHLDRATKVATISSLATGSPLDVLEAELAKCQLLCRWHHRIVQRRAA